MRVPRVNRGLTTDRPLPGLGPVRDAASLGARPGRAHLAASQPRVLAAGRRCVLTGPQPWALAALVTGDHVGDTRGHEEPVTSGIRIET